MISVCGLSNVFQDLSRVALFGKCLGSPKLGHRHLASPSIAYTLWHARSRVQPALPAEFATVRNIMLRPKVKHMSVANMNMIPHCHLNTLRASPFVWREFRTTPQDPGRAVRTQFQHA